MILNRLPDLLDEEAVAMLEDFSELLMPEQYLADFDELSDQGKYLHAEI